MPDLKKTLDVYVRLAAHACEMKSEDFRPILEGYYELRRVAEEPPEETQVTQDAFEIVTPGVPSRGTAARAFKRGVRDRIEALRQKGVSLQSILDAAGGGVNMHEICSVLEAQRVDYAVYKALDAGLRKLDAAE